MAFNPNDYPEEYAVIKEVWQKYISGEHIEDLDRFAYYKSKGEMFKQNFLTTTADHRKERIYLEKSRSAFCEAKGIASSIHKVWQDEALTNYCSDMLETMGPRNVSRFWGS